MVLIRGGDWLDSVNRAGLRGRGESVMTTEQIVMSLLLLPGLMKHAAKRCKFACDWDALEKEFAERAEKFQRSRGGRRGREAP